MKMTVEKFRKILDAYYTTAPPQYGKFILGIDFDGTLCYSNFPDCGEETPICKWLRECQNAGLNFLTAIVTCRNKEQKEGQAALYWLSAHGIRVDLYNENEPGLIQSLGECRKIFCNMYIDDRNMGFNMEDFE